MTETNQYELRRLIREVAASGDRESVRELRDEYIARFGRHGIRCDRCRWTPPAEFSWNKPFPFRCRKCKELEGQRAA